jgi:FkbM family methyltransferase
MKLSKVVIKNFVPFLVGKKDFIVKLDDGVAFYTAPRTDHIFVLYETWIKKDYESSIKIEGVKTVVDIGAHIGDFTVWAYKEFNPSKIIALEPSSDLFKLLEKNIVLNKCDQVVTDYNSAIYSKDTTVSVKKGASSALNSVLEDENGSVKAITLQTLMSENNINFIDLLKIDIEGGEKNILIDENKDFFKNNVKYLFMECHDLNGNKKELAGDYFRSIDYTVEETTIPWFFGIRRIQAVNNKFL